MPESRRERIKTMLDALETPSKPMTAWENLFVESVADQFERKGDLSDRQMEILDKIYTEKW